MDLDEIAVKKLIHEGLATLSGIGTSRRYGRHKTHKKKGAARSFKVMLIELLGGYRS